MITSDSLDERVAEIIIKKLPVAKGRTGPDTSLIDDLGADSIDLVELVMAMEEEFSITIPDEDAERIQTVGGAIEYVKQKIAAM